ncbi:hypothetical protein GF376_02105 [Candidatus Peregrinibacteria bacterium]|nr:hypothetical protein [Candidatus Peregrinibacteria bacterium]
MRKNTTSNKIEAILSAKGILTAAEISKLLPELDRATVYRNINKMVKDRKISKISTKGLAKSYELSKHQHMHLICDDCGEIYHLEPSKVILKEIQKIKRDFDTRDLELVVRGKCNKSKHLI